jgi:hypothetical protein
MNGCKDVASGQSSGICGKRVSAFVAANPSQPIYFRLPPYLVQSRPKVSRSPGSRPRYVKSEVRLLFSEPVAACGMNMPRRIKLSRREEWKTLAIIFLVAGIPLVATAALIVVSMRPDLGNIRFFHAPIETEAMTIDWPTLYRLNAKDPTVEYIRALLPTSPVRIPGYMITFEQTPDKNREVTQFLLVPDPGNWLHPPHLDPGEVVFVRLEGGAKARFVERKPVWATGKLSLSPVKRGTLEGAYPMWAIAIQEFADTK